jgi:hypothetical protein
MTPETMESVDAAQAADDAEELQRFRNDVLNVRDQLIERLSAKIANYGGKPVLIETSVTVVIDGKNAVIPHATEVRPLSSLGCVASCRLIDCSGGDDDDFLGGPIRKARYAVTLKDGAK